MAQRRRTRQQWQALVDGWASSGLTQGEYCRRQGISVASFARWRAIFRRARQRQPAEPTPSAGPTHSLVPVHWLSDDAPTATTATTALSLHCPGGLRLDIGVGVDVSTLQQVIRLLRAAAS
ncbi:IS66 family insertion sequence element accessory protein TnpA [Thiorhodovibrio frisius]|uniref:Transposase n=1 Tax=Thiorhodovibrio frisius TaxID=631362 RepID=H8YZJ3_9GAMM|nr:hypothetical protein [Thiorhodovibrio frisius]EIC22120.1 hypothetical protein Thi970DRAFT_02368 [Thiorhodovibrio frisius]WPL20131.1 hypothetical protein Thiofri_00191 [Thiorhodovibrio frisius]WPL24413.1 hypothetical protein Thiofri_04632 [Thiorhodovibrio frisius]